MKKKISFVLTVLLAAVLLASCSSKATYDSSGSTTDTLTTSSNESSSLNDALVSAAGAAGDYSFEGEVSFYEETDFSEKMIYTASAEIETIDFDSSVNAVYDMLDNYGAFLESSYVTGNSYRTQFYGYQSYRYAEFVIRVPASGYNNLTQNLGVLGNVLNLNQSAENITEQYYDAQSRLDTYSVEEDRLLAMLEKADNVSDMIELESRISDVRYQIEALESKLRNWQNQVDYSTVTIYLNEVVELTEVVEVQRTYWQQIGDGITASAKSVGNFFKSLFKSIVISLPVIVTIAVFAVIVFFIVRKFFTLEARERRREKREERRGKKKENDKNNGE